MDRQEKNIESSEATDDGSARLEAEALDAQAFDSQAMIDRVLAGNHAEFGQLVEHYAWTVRSFVHSRIAVDADAEDVSQEVFIAAFRGLGQFIRGQDFGAWLLGIARHRVQMHYRSRGRRESAYDNFRHEMILLLESELNESQSPFGDEMVGRLEECIERLPERMRRVIRARLRGCDGAEIASSLKCTVNAVYMLQIRALKSLRSCLMQGTR